MIDPIYKSLPPIERRPDGSLYRMTPTQRRQASALIQKNCCNCDHGNCLLQDDGESHPCTQMISYSVCCRYFRWIVLPNDRALEAEIFKDRTTKHCVECGAAFVPGSNRAKYCPNCAAKVHRQQKNASDRKRRWNTDK